MESFIGCVAASACRTSSAVACLRSQTTRITAFSSGLSGGVFLARIPATPIDEEVDS